LCFHGRENDSAMDQRSAHRPLATMLGALGLALAFLISAGSGSVRAAGELRVLASFDWPPFTYLDKGGTPAGFEVEFANAICAVLERPCKFVDTRFDDIIPALVAGRGDVIISALSITEERKQSVSFTLPYLRTPLLFVARRGFIRPTTNDGLKGARIGVKTGSTEEATVRKLFPDAVAVSIAGGVDETGRNRMFARLQAGDVDLVLVTELVAWSFASSQGGEFALVGQSIRADTAVGMAVRKDDDALRQKLNAALVRIRLDGTYKKINAKYFPFSLDAGS